MWVVAEEFSGRVYRALVRGSEIVEEGDYLEANTVPLNDFLGRVALDGNGDLWTIGTFSVLRLTFVAAPEVIVQHPQGDGNPEDLVIGFDRSNNADRLIGL